MSAWRTHLPDTYKPGKVTGLGMNADEMRDNPQLNEFSVQNLNKNPTLPYTDQTFDGAICTVSVQYLTEPVRVFKEVYRVLKPGAPFCLTYSNRCFPTKAVMVWQSISMEQKAQLVASYLKEAGFAELHAEDRSPQQKRGLFGGGSDPLIGVWGYRPAVEG
jgi:SAM-dependent methyltransferase